MDTRSRRIPLAAAAALLLLSVSATSAHAFRFTPVTALAGATQRQQTVGGVSSASDGLAGFGGGFSWETPLNERYGLELGGFYLLRKYGTLLVTNAFSAVELPVQIRANLGNFSLGAGGFLIHDLGSIRTTDTNGSTTQTFAAAGLKTIEAGVMGSAGLVIPWSTTAGVLFEGRFLKGLTNSSTAAGTTERFTDIQFMLGLTFGTRFSYSPELE